MPTFNVVENTEFSDVSSPSYLEIAEGMFKGTAFVFGPIEFVGEDEDGSGRISFDYSLLQVDPAHNLADESTKAALEDNITTILHQILQESIARDVEIQARDEVNVLKHAADDDLKGLDEDTRNTDSE